MLRQAEVDFRRIKRGEIFCLEATDESGNTTVTDWSIALEDAREDSKHPGQYVVPADRLYFLTGKPEIQNHLLRPLEAPKKVFSQSSKGKAH